MKLPMRGSSRLAWSGKWAGPWGFAGLETTYSIFWSCASFFRFSTIFRRIRALALNLSCLNVVLPAVGRAFVGPSREM